MGDAIELCTPDEEAYYSASASSIAFEVRSESVARVCLCTSLNEIAYQLHLANTNVKILEGTSTLVSRPTPGSLAKGFRQFWLRWDRGLIRFGEAGRTAPYMKCSADNLDKIKFICFSRGNRLTEVCEWKFDVAPERPISEKNKLLSGGEPTWVAVTDGVPPLGTVIGGYENEPLRVVRAVHDGFVIPGKHIASEGKAYVGWDGRVRSSTEFEALVGTNLEWVPVVWRDPHYPIPAGAVPASYYRQLSSRSDELLYIGRAEHNGHLLVGKVHRSYNCIFLPYQGREVAKTSFDILVSLPLSRRRPGLPIPGNILPGDAH